MAQYARVATLIPLVIQYKTAAIIRKQQQYACLVTLGEWIMLAFIVALWFVLIFTNLGDIANNVGWSICSIILSIALGYSFRRIRQLSKKLKTTGIFCNERLMNVHYGCFLSATILSIPTPALLIASNAES